jgi:hypothetical protein
MRVFSLLILLALSPDGARAQTVGEMLHAGEMLRCGVHVEDRVFLPPRPDASRCWGFMEAVNHSILAAANGKTLLNACPGEHRSISTIAQSFVDYVRTHPDKQSLPAAAEAYNAMSDAFP